MLVDSSGRPLILARFFALVDWPIQTRPVQRGCGRGGARQARRTSPGGRARRGRRARGRRGGGRRSGAGPARSRRGARRLPRAAPRPARRSGAARPRAVRLQPHPHRGGEARREDVVPGARGGIGPARMRPTRFHPATVVTCGNSPCRLGGRNVRSPKGGLRVCRPEIEVTRVSPASAAPTRSPLSMPSQRVPPERPRALTLHRVGPAMDDVPSPGGFGWQIWSPWIDRGESDTQRAKYIPMVIRHRIITGDENPRARITEGVHKRSEQRLVLEPVKLELGQGYRIATTCLQLGRHPIVHICVDDKLKRRHRSLRRPARTPERLATRRQRRRSPGRSRRSRL